MNSVESKEILVSEQNISKPKKKILPKSNLIRLRELFNSLDGDKKGYLAVDDLKKKFTNGFTTKEIEELFRDND